jgi:hypothetical protein
LGPTAGRSKPLDAFNLLFPTALRRSAAIAGQKALAAASWNELGELKVRMGIHTGEAELDPAGDEYAVSHSKNRVARIMSAASGRQILLSAETTELVNHQLPAGVTLKDLGEQRLKGISIPEHLYQVCAPGLAQEFPPLATAITHPNNLPIRLTSFIGRDKEIAAVYELLAEYRLVTLTGSGGTGKTAFRCRWLVCCWKTTLTAPGWWSWLPWQILCWFPRRWLLRCIFPRYPVSPL